MLQIMSSVLIGDDQNFEKSVGFGGGVQTFGSSGGLNVEKRDLNVENMLDVVCSPKCCFNMWNICGYPYPHWRQLKRSSRRVDCRA